MAHTNTVLQTQVNALVNEKSIPPKKRKADFSQQALIRAEFDEKDTQTMSCEPPIALVPEAIRLRNAQSSVNPEISEVSSISYDTSSQRVTPRRVEEVPPGLARDA